MHDQIGREDWFDCEAKLDEEEEEEEDDGDGKSDADVWGIPLEVNTPCELYGLQNNGRERTGCWLKYFAVRKKRNDRTCE